MNGSGNLGALSYLLSRRFVIALPFFHLMKTVMICGKIIRIGRPAHMM